jgi:hypothetical protein
MQTECSPALFAFAPVEGRAVVAGFDGGAITSDAGALLLAATDRSIGLVRRFAACFNDARDLGAGRVRDRHSGRPARLRHRARLRGQHVGRDVVAERHLILPEAETTQPNADVQERSKRRH